MCLFTNQLLPRKTDEDIVCYKVMSLVDANTAVSPYLYFKYELGKLYETLMDNANIDKICKTRIVERGFHSYKNIDTCESSIEYRFDNMKIFKCTIPKDSCIFEGLDVRTGKCFVSNKIIINEIICV